MGDSSLTFASSPNIILSLFLTPKESFSSSYNLLHLEIQNLFKEKWDDIKSGKLIPENQKGIGTIHTMSELKELDKLCPIDWNENIAVYKEKLSQCLRNEKYRLR